ncbi:MAG: protease pro-enzyme activation domain-containing protein [Terracidiphilus sp.]
MITKLLQGQDRLRVCGWIAAFALASTAVAAQTPTPRIRSEISNVAVSPLRATQQPLGSTQFDAGRMPSDAKLNGMSIVFNRSTAQEAHLQALIAAQQDPRSPQYHQWLSPEQFGARFGMAQSDMDKVQTWLQQQGFAIASVARGRNMIRFSGTAGQVEQAFQTQMHYFKTNGETHFAPATLLSVPTAIAPTIAAVRDLSDFKPRPMHISTHRAFTSGQSGNVFFAPGDIAVTYDINPLYSPGGITGAGQSIAIVGQSAVLASDIEAFETAAGLPVKDPVMVLVPGSGASKVVAGGDEGESDLDIEWSGAIAKGATIDFVYTGNGGNLNAFDSIAYAIDEKIAPIISVSYGACETALGGFSLETQLAQAAVQGQTVLAASGDQGSTACSGDTTNNLTTAQQFALAVNYPASSPYVTGVGGTEISAANSVSTNSTYWVGQGTSDALTSAKTYIPEIVWNDDSTQFGLGATGGGTSALFARPTWQTGVTGIPSGTKRLVPDVSLYSSAGFPGYLFCSSDTSDWAQASGTTPAQAASCNSGFRDSTSGDLTVAGGTSFATPIFAGMIALINQKQEWTDGQGLANPTLYTLAAGANYSTLFHDVTSGNNNCTAGSTYCGTTTTGFSAGTGYDQVTGLGSVDLANIAGAWAKNATPLVATTTAVSAASASPNVSTDDVVTITVAQVGGTATPTGTVNLSIDGSGTAYGATGSTTTPVTLTNGTATYTANFSTAGAHTIVAQYAGDAANAPSTSSVVITVGGATSGKGTFAMTFSPTTLTLSQGSQGTEALTVTPSGGYTGTISFSFSTSNDTALANLCVFAGTGFNTDTTMTVPGTAAVTGTVTIDTNASDCVSSTGGAVKGRGLRVIPHTGGSVKASNNTPKRNNPVPAGIAFAGLVLAGFLGRSSRKLRQLACVIALASLGLAISACGGGGGSSGGGSKVPNPAKGTYTITLAGQDSVTTTIKAQQSFTLVIK